MLMMMAMAMMRHLVMIWGREKREQEAVVQLHFLASNAVRGWSARKRVGGTDGGWAVMGCLDGSKCGRVDIA